MISEKDKELLDLVTQELDDSENNLDFETPLNYYLGNPMGNEVEGRSQVVSTDVADVIEWIMPQIMKSFTQNNEIVIFDPIHPEDEKQAELESQYVYEILMKENDGFIILHQFVKDALMQANGYIKVYYEDRTKEHTVDYTALTLEQLQAVLMNPNADIKSAKPSKITAEEMGIMPPQQPAMGPPAGSPPPGMAPTAPDGSQPGIPPGQQMAPPMPQPVIQLIDAKIIISTPAGRIVIESVAPEDFRYNLDHNSINVDDARFTAHLMTKTVSELREDDVDEATIAEIMDGDDEVKKLSDYRFTAQGEQTDDDESDDDSTTEVDIAECYMYADIDDDGIAEFVKVTVAGITTPSVILDVEEISTSPWICTTAILMSHKLRGLSIYERIKQIQDQKTALLRNTLDNISLQNNQRHLVLEGQCTIADLMTSRPGGVVRVKSQNAVTPLVTPPISQDSFVMMKYLDEVRAGRSGVSPEGNASKHSIGERIGSEGLERLMSAKEELVGLIVRVVAETGVKPLCIKIRDLCTRHLDAVRDYKYRGEWQKVNPAEWPMRSRTTVRVGTGTGDHEKQLASINAIIDKQFALMQMPSQVLVNPGKMFKALDDFAKFSGLNSAVGYFIDPNTPEGQQTVQAVMQKAQEAMGKQDQQTTAQLEFQAKLAQAEMEKSKSLTDNVILKGQVEQAKQALQLSNQENDLVIKQLKQELDSAKLMTSAAEADAKMSFDKEKHYDDVALKLTDLELQAKAQLDAQMAQNKETADDSGKQRSAS